MTFNLKFDSRHYVPVLKIKEGEKTALKRVALHYKARITPLLEAVERNPEKGKTVGDHIATTFSGLGVAVDKYDRFFLDCREIAPDGATAAADVFKRAANENMKFTPVTGISRSVDVEAALAHRERGVAIRLTRDEFEADRIGQGLETFMRAHDLAHDNVDLILDLGAVDNMVTPGVRTLMTGFLAQVPDQTRWRTLTVSACAFPRSMGIVETESFDFIDRSEWMAWRDGLQARQATLVRLPTFSDCAIQHTSGVEDFDFKKHSVSASVRFTVTERWLLIKGVSTKKVKPSKQFPSLATKLVYGQFRPQFVGPTHCRGCEDMQLAADGAPNIASAGKWRTLGTIHHLTRAVEQIDGLTWT